MPWEHCDMFILDTERCPTCGIDKEEWTVQVDLTRTFVIPVPKKKGAWIELELLDHRGEPIAQGDYAVELGNGRKLEGKLDDEGVAKLTKLFHGAAQVAFPGRSLRDARWRVTGLEEQPGEPPPAPPRKVLASKLAMTRGRSAAGAYAIRHPHRQEPLEPEDQDGPPTDWERYPEELSLTPAQLKAGGGQRYTFWLAPPRIKVDLAFRLNTRTRTELQTLLMRHPLEVQVDGQRVSYGAFADGPNRVVVQVEVPEGEHDVIVYRREQEGQKRVRPLVYMSRRLNVGPEGVRPDDEHATKPRFKQRGGKIEGQGPAAKTKPKPRASVVLELLDEAGQPLANQEYTCRLGDGSTRSGKLDARGRARVRGVPAGELKFDFPGQDVERARWTVDAGGPKRKAKPAPQGKAPSKLGLQRGRSGRGDRTLKHPSLEARQADKPVAPPLGPRWESASKAPALNEQQVARGGGQRFTYRLTEPLAKIDLSLRLPHRTLAETQRSLVSHPLEVQLDGERIPCGAFAESAGKVIVQIAVPPGTHTVVVYRREQSRQDGKSIRPLVYLSRELNVARS